MKQLWCRQIPDSKDNQWVVGVAMTVDGGTVAAVAGSEPRDRFLVTWGGEQWSERRATVLKAPPLAVAMCPRGGWIAVAGADRRIRIFNPALEQLETLTGHPEWPRVLAASPDGRWLASADRKSGIRLWNTGDWSLARKIPQPADSLHFDRPGRRLLAAVARPMRGAVKTRTAACVFDVGTGKLRGEFKMHKYLFTCAAFSPSGKTVACGVEAEHDSLDQQAVLIDVRTGRVVDRLAADLWGHDGFAFLPARKAIAVAARGHNRRPLVLWQVPTRAA